MSAGQDCHAEESGAHTGDVSAEMLKDAGASHVIVGHSERRADHEESDVDVRAKAEAAWRAGLVAILCIGESKDEREDDEKAQRLEPGQIEGFAAEGRERGNPGGGGARGAPANLGSLPMSSVGRSARALTPTVDDVAEAHRPISAPNWRAAVGEGDAGAGCRILYGGSSNPPTRGRTHLMACPMLTGRLVGGASLKADDFLLAIAEAYRGL